MERKGKVRLHRYICERKDSAGSDDTSSLLIKGGDYVGARTMPPPIAQTIKKKLMWVRGVVCRSTRTQSLTVVAACVICAYLVFTSAEKKNYAGSENHFPHEVKEK